MLLKTSKRPKMNKITIDNTSIYIQVIPDLDGLMANATTKDLDVIKNISSVSRKKEKLATSKMLRDIFDNKYSLKHNDNGAPYLENPHYNISISHSKDDVAIAINPTKIIGIDTEIWREQLIKISSRFLSPTELSIYNTPELLLRAWTTKEAIYKASLSPGLTFTDNICLPTNPNHNTATAITPQGELQFAIHHICAFPEKYTTLAIRE